MTNTLKKSFYIVATKNGEFFYQEGQYTEQEINRWINEFDIDEFINDEATGEEYTGPEEGMYAIYRQSMMTFDEEVSLGLVNVTHNSDGTMTCSYKTDLTPEQEAIQLKRKQELQQEVEQEYPDDGFVCLKSYIKTVV